VYKYQIMFRFSILYFHFESSKEKKEERKTLEKHMTKDLDKLINLFNVKLFSEDDESNPDTFYNELAEVSSLSFKKKSHWNNRPLQRRSQILIF